MYTDLQIVEGIQQHDKAVERGFYNQLHSYFTVHFSLYFFNEEMKREIFQSSIVKLWTEIENKTITIIDGKIYRKRRRHEYVEMTASLNTFLMAFAKNEYREILRDFHDDNLEELMVFNPSMTVHIEDENYEEEKIRIVDECIRALSPNCIEILTLFYYQNKSLDEIMSIRDNKNTSKDGLKTAKNKCMTTLRRLVGERMYNLQ